VKQKLFATRVLPLFIVGHILILFQNTDVGGAQRDARVGHLPLIRYIATHNNLPFPGDYHVANIPVWHIFASFLYRITYNTFFISIFQIGIAIATLLLLNSIMKYFVTENISILLVSSVALNSYFISSSHFPTTDGLAIFTFTLFLFSLHRLFIYPEKFKYLLLANFAIVISALNRQMFVILFLIYLLAFIKNKSLLRIIIEILPSLLLVFIGFYLFYFKYCDFLNSDVCWPIRQSRDLVFPVIVNLPVTCSLIVIFLLPILLNRGSIDRKSILVCLSFIFGLLIFMETYGNKKILSEKNMTGGGLYKFRELLGSLSIFFDVISIGFFSLLSLLVMRKIKSGFWVYQSLFVIVFSSIFGPYAFQRYYEPYILILGCIFLAINRERIFLHLKFSMKHWSYFLIFFQLFEFVASVFIRV